MEYARGRLSGPVTYFTPSGYHAPLPLVDDLVLQSMTLIESPAGRIDPPRVAQWTDRYYFPYTGAVVPAGRFAILGYHAPLDEVDDLGLQSMTLIEALKRQSPPFPPRGA